MTISIHSVHSHRININLLEIAGKILKNYKFGETYSIELEIDFDTHFITDGGDIRDRYFISKTGLIIDHRYEYEIDYEEDSAGVSSEATNKTEARTYSDTDFMQIVSWRMERGLKQIGCIDIKSDITDNKIILSFELDGLSQREYREFLLTLVESEIARLNPIMTIEKMKLGIVNAIRKLSEQFESNDIILAESDISIQNTFGVASAYQREHDVIRIFECYLPASPIDLLIYMMIFERKIESVKLMDGNHYRLVLSEETSAFKPRVVGPIHFDKQNGFITLHGNEVGVLDKDTRYYQFFEILYDNYNTLVSPDKICNHMDVTKSDTATYDYVRGVKADLRASNKIQIDFFDSYIHLRNGLFILGE